MGGDNLDALQAQIADLSQRLLRLETIIRGDPKDFIQIVAKQINLLADESVAVSSPGFHVYASDRIKLITQQELQIKAKKITGDSPISSSSDAVKKLVGNQNNPIGQH